MSELEEKVAPVPSTVADLMRRDVVTVSPAASIRELAALLRSAGVSGVPVVEEGRVVGTVSVTDVMWLGDARSLFEGDAAQRAAAARRLSERTVRQVMTADVFGLQPEASLAELAAFFARSGLGRAIIQKEGKLLGIVSVTDLLGLIADAPNPENEK
jgi:CBS-domain-containing membrane protein